MLRSTESREALAFNDDGLPTHTTEEQVTTEKQIGAVYAAFERLFVGEPLTSEDRQLDAQPPISFRREGHIAWARRGLFEQLMPGYASLDSARPWIVYWNLHSLDLLHERPDADELARARDVIRRCCCPTGGIAGSPGIMSHLASAYAAVNALMIIGDEPSYLMLDRRQTHDWLQSMHQPDGSYTMHVGGEADCRSAYCAVVIASYYNILTPALRKGLAEWIVSCQTYEGGLGGSPGTEAHGGYTYCGVAALSLLGELDKLNMPRLLHWMVNRQMRLEGGFQGRTNKLVDSCYSLWQGGLFAIVAGEVKKRAQDISDPYLMNRGALQDYIMICAQMQNGGFRDKPGKSRDFYHTCYSLSGLSVSQFLLLPAERVGDVHQEPFNDPELFMGQTNPTHPIFNVGVAHVRKALDRFGSLPPLEV